MSVTSPYSTPVSAITSHDESHRLLDGRLLQVKHWCAPESANTKNQPSGVTLVMLHGWLDNAGSFDRLAPCLMGQALMEASTSINACCAIDLAGHGESDHRQDFLPYTLWDDAIDVCAWIKAQGLTSVVMVGHSRGAMVASLVASMLEEQVSHLLLLDGAWPAPQAETGVVKALQKALEQRTDAPKKATRFPTRQAAIQARANARFSISLASAECLAKRGLVQQGSAYVWRADPKLHLIGGVKLSFPALQALSQNIRASVHLWIADQGVLTDIKAQHMLRQVFPVIQCHSIEGNHHFHMDDAIVTKLAEHINALFAGVS